MQAINDLAKRINNLIIEGTISQIRRSAFGDEIRAEVVNNDTDKRVTDWIPIVNFADSRVKRYDPVQVGDSVIILSPDGLDSWKAIALIGRWCKNVKSPALANDTTSVTEYSDGTIITYDTAAKKLFATLAGSAEIHVTDNADITIGGNVNLTVSGDVTANISGDLTAKAANATLKAETVTVDSPSIDLGKGGTGVVTQESFCCITGLPHLFFSANTRSKM
jgi:phage baseplate assembly protein V